MTKKKSLRSAEDTLLRVVISLALFVYTALACVVVYGLATCTGALDGALWGAFLSVISLSAYPLVSAARRDWPA